MTTQTISLKLADEYARAQAIQHIESLYGTSKSYTKEKTREANEARELLAAELRRLEAANAELLESLISIAEDSSDEGARECAMDAIAKHGGAA